jgi:putative ABC transport system permease protein
MKQDKHTSPPQWIQRWIEKYCEPFLWEGISGDLQELFLENVETRGVRKAHLVYVFQALGFFRMRFRKRSKTQSNMKSIWHNYLLTSYRSLRRNKTFLFINLIGLTIAITCSLFALVFIHDELQFNEHIAGSENIYRLYKQHINEAENVNHFTYETSGMMGPTMQEEYPEINDFVRVLPWWNKVILTHEKTNVSSQKVYFADSNFFHFFQHELIIGNAKTALTAPSSIVLSQQLANVLFKHENPIGKVIIGLNDLNYTVTGVFQNPPRQSSMQYEAIVSWSTTVPGIGPLNYSWMNNWLAQGIYTFVKLPNDVKSEEIVGKLPDMMNRHFAERADNYFLQLLPLKEMYLKGDEIRTERLASGSFTFVLTLAFSALLVFVIASVNYVNIMLSRSSQTRTEVGIRKVLGSTKSQLIGRFVSETFISTLIASIISFGILMIILPEIIAVTGKELPLNALFQPIVFIYLFSFIVGISLIVGFYPAMVISSPAISTILQKSSTVGSAGWFRKVLLTLQYCISIFLLICTVIVIKQTNYLKDRPLGFEKEQVLVIELNAEMEEKAMLLEELFLKHPNILNVSTTYSAIGSGSYSTTVIPEGYTDELGTRIFEVDQEFFETFGIKTAFGRTFHEGSSADSMNIIVNQTMVDFMGWGDPVGKHIRMSPEGRPFPIIGVVNDFHISSLATSVVEPMILFLNTYDHYNSSIRIGNGDVKGTIDHIQDSWDQLSEKTPLEFFFVDQWFNELYQKETQLLKMSTTYSIISILLCGLGLYGLTALILQQREKEISIRKVLGASISSIVSLVNKQFVFIILISFLIAAPLAYYLISKWLEEFAYKISIDAVAFTIAGVVTLGVSILIISGLSIRTANTNPSKTLSRE